MFEYSYFPSLCCRVWWRLFLKHVRRMRDEGGTYTPGQKASSDKPWIGLFLDSFDSHIYDVQTLWEAYHQRVLFINFLGHATHLLQPLDQALFSAYKCYFRSGATKLNWLLNNRGQELTIFEFVKIAQRALEKSLSVSNITEAFRVTGISPFDKNLRIRFAELGKFEAHSRLTRVPALPLDRLRVGAMDAVRDGRHHHLFATLISPIKRPRPQLPIATVADQASSSTSVTDPSSTSLNVSGQAVKDSKLANTSFESASFAELALSDPTALAFRNGVFFNRHSSSSKSTLTSGNLHDV